MPAGAEAAAVRRARPPARVIALRGGIAAAAALPAFDAGETVFVLGLCGALWRLAVHDVAIYARVVDGAHAFDLDPRLVDRLAAALPRATVVNACTTRRVVTTVESRTVLAQRFNADVVDLEGTHLAAALASQRVRYAMVRVVSDDAAFDAPPIDDAIDAHGRMRPLEIASAFARAPAAAFRFVRDARAALRGLTAVARVVGAFTDRP